MSNKFTEFVSKVKKTFSDFRDGFPETHKATMQLLEGTKVAGQNPPLPAPQSLNLPRLSTANGEQATTDKPLAEAYGVTGTQRYGGFSQEEYLLELQGRNGVYKFDEMFRSDSQVFTSIMRGNNKLKSAKYFVEATNKKDKQASERAKFLHKALFNFTNKCWLDTLNEILSFRHIGFSVFEPTYKIEKIVGFGDILVVASLGWRNPKTIWQWFVKKEDLYSIRQISYGDEYRYIDIPASYYMVQKGKDGKNNFMSWSQLIVFTNLLYGNGFEGISLLRPMYGEYKRKDTYHKTNALGIENNARGITNVTVPETQIGTPLDEKMDSILNRATVTNVPWRKFLKGWDVKFEKTDYQSDPVMKSILMADASISKVTQTESSELGMTSVGSGSRALGDSKGAEHDEAIKNEAIYICEKLSQIVKYLEIYNFGEQKDYCKLSFIGIDSKPSYEDAQKLSVLAQAGFIDPANNIIKAYVHEHFDIPSGEEIQDAEDEPAPPPDKPTDITKEVKEHGETIKKVEDLTAKGTPPKVEQVAQAITDDHKKNLSEHKHKKTIRPKRTLLTEYERKVNFAEIDRTSKSFVAKYNELFKNSFDNFVLPKYKSDLEKALKENKTFEEKLQAVVKIQLTKRDKITSLLADLLSEIVIAGKVQVGGELTGSKTNKNKTLSDKKPIANASDLTPKMTAWVSADAELITKKQMENLESELVFTAKNSLENEFNDEETIQATMNAGTAYSEDINSLGAGYGVAEAINNGRYEMFQENKDALQGFQFSALLENSCDLCLELDETTFSIDDEASVEYTPPLHPLCNCILVPITMEEETPDWEGLDKVVEKEFDIKDESSPDYIGRFKKL